MLIWMLVLDVIKLALYRRLRHVAVRPQWYRRFLGSRHAARGVAEAAKAEA
jgi:hypothetical protein